MGNNKHLTNSAQRQVDKRNAVFISLPLCVNAGVSLSLVQSSISFTLSALPCLIVPGFQQVQTQGQYHHDVLGLEVSLDYNLFRCYMFKKISQFFSFFCNFHTKPNIL